jgi:hypothetical protein
LTIFFIKFKRTRNKYSRQTADVNQKAKNNVAETSDIVVKTSDDDEMNPVRLSDGNGESSAAAGETLKLNWQKTKEKTKRN